METVAPLLRYKAAFISVLPSSLAQQPKMSLVGLTKKTVDVLLGRDLGTDKSSLSVSFITHTLLSAIGRAYDQVRKL